MNLIQAIILSVVEGITEFLPISSTGHLILTTKLLGILDDNFVKSFEIIIQIGAILAVVVWYRDRILNILRLWKQIIVAFIPTAVVGLVFYKLIKNYLLGNDFITVLALGLGGVVIIVVEKWVANRKNPVTIEKLDNKRAFLIGLFQSLSVIPGVSRAGATILGGLFLKMKREDAVEFSFLLAIPTLMAATGLDLVKSNFDFTSNQWFLLLVGIIGSFISATLVIKWFLQYVKTNSLIAFGVYRIIVAILFWILVK